MSRLIVKNLPTGITEHRLRELFGKKGRITDIQLKYTKEGVFRKFGFVGYQTNDEAEAAVKHFHNTCINTSRVTVELCSALGAETKPKSWSKYATDSSAFQKIHNVVEKKTDESEDEQAKKEKKVNKKSKDDRLDEIYGEHRNDPNFIEFLKVHDNNAELWENDLGVATSVPDESIPSSAKITHDAVRKGSNGESSKLEKAEETEDDDDDDDDDDDNDGGNQSPEIKLADQEISDADYLKALMNKKEEKKPAVVAAKKEKVDVLKTPDLFTIKIREIPFATKRKDLIAFFKPVKPFSIRLPTTSHGFCYVGFKTEKDFKKAMIKDRSFLKGKQVHFTDFTEKNKESKQKKGVEGADTSVGTSKNSKWAQQEEALKNEEDISESGRIFFRNLTYTVTEDQVQEHFEKFGPITEIALPIDPHSRRIKGFGVVTYVMPEHAVVAFAQLDGTIFHGRLLHLIPGKSKDTDEQNTDGLSFKQQKELKDKQTAGSSHNWNTLFMGANAVADILAKNYETTKEQILDTEGGGSSAAVRLALGETELVLHMRKFLVENDVVLEAFEQTSQKRSKTVILAKNLPADTQITEIQPLFSKFGLLGRIVLPPSGVTAIIEFLEPSEARAAFRKLAYSKFKHLPLYLEWAPENTFKAPATKPLAEISKPATDMPPPNTSEDQNQVTNKKHNAFSKQNSNLYSKAGNRLEQECHVLNEPAPGEVDSTTVDEDEDTNDNTEPEPNTTLFLRNLNFNTREDAIRQHFKHIGRIHHIQVAMKKDPDNPANRTSLGYGFIQFKLKAQTEKALKTMQFTMIEGNSVELKRSDRTLQTQVKTNRKPTASTPQTGTKILVRNIPFQAKQSEVRDLFKAFGELKSVRVPKKMAQGSEDSHRGFGFVDYHTKSDAKKAFDALCHSSHLYGRRLVLEWAAADEGVEELRKRTADHFHESESAVKKNRKAIFDTTKIKKIKGNADGDDDNEDDDEA